MPIPTNPDHLGSSQREPTQRQVAAAILKVRRFHEVGCRCLKVMPNLPRSKADIIKFEGLHGELLRKARAFAREETGYTRTELRDLLAACSTQRYTIGISHVIKLLSLPKTAGSGGLRANVQAKAIAGRWSRRRLEQECAKRPNTGSKPVGRRVRTPISPAEAASRLDEFCGHWGRLRAAIVDTPPATARNTSPQPPPALDGDILDAIQGVERAVGRLVKVLSGDRAKTRPRTPGQS